MKKVKLAILGATGMVGQALLEILYQRQFPIEKLYPLASTSGKPVGFGHSMLETIAASEFDFGLVDIGLFSAGSDASKKYAPLAAEQGCIVIDNTSCFRYDDDVPLVVPEVNPEMISLSPPRGIIANPNCSTIQMLLAIKPLHDRVGVSRINVATYQAVSGSGHTAVEELIQQMQAKFTGEQLVTNVYPKVIANNAIPQIDIFLENGYTKEEMKMHWETQKILNDKGVHVNATCVRIPVFNGHSEAIHLETREKISLAEAKACLRAAPGLKLVEGNDYPTALSADGQDTVYVGRLREDISHPRGLNFWCVGDNLRKGAALNAIQIAEKLCELQNK